MELFTSIFMFNRMNTYLLDYEQIKPCSLALLGYSFPYTISGYAVFYVFYITCRTKIVFSFMRVNSSLAYAGFEPVVSGGVPGTVVARWTAGQQVNQVILLQGHDS